MTDIEYWDADLTKKLNELEGEIANLKSVFGGDKDSCAQKCDILLKKVRESKKSYSYEMRMSLKNDPRRGEFQEKLKQAEDRLQALETELKWAKADADKKTLFKSPKGGGGGAGGLNADSSNDDYLKAAKDIQDKTADAYKGALDLVNATKDVALNTMDQLNAQKKQIADIIDEVDEMNDGLKRADKLLRAFSRRIATDKFIQLFFVLNFGALLGIIVWYAVKKGKIRTPKIVTPPPPSFTGSAAHIHIGPPMDIPEHARKYLR